MTETCGGVVFDGRPLPGVSVEAALGRRLRITGTQVAQGYRDGRRAQALGRAARRAALLRSPTTSAEVSPEVLGQRLRARR